MDELELTARDELESSSSLPPPPPPLEQPEKVNANAVRITATRNSLLGFVAMRLIAAI
jgi:hypothetical protein